MTRSSLLFGCGVLALVLVLLVTVLQAPHGAAAPTHHQLTIGVEGKTLTLVETSEAEVAGPMPARLDAITAAASTTDTAIVRTTTTTVAKDAKGALGAKQKAQKSTKLQSLAKKRQYYAAKEKLAWHAKTMITTTATTTTTAAEKISTTTATATTTTAAAVPAQTTTTRSRAPTSTAETLALGTAELSTTDATADHGETARTTTLGQLPAERRQTAAATVAMAEPDASDSDLTTLPPPFATTTAVQHDNNINAAASVGPAWIIEALPTTTTTTTTATARVAANCNSDSEQPQTTAAAAATATATTATTAPAMPTPVSIIKTTTKPITTTTMPDLRTTPATSEITTTTDSSSTDKTTMAAAPASVATMKSHGATTPSIATRAITTATTTNTTTMGKTITAEMAIGVKVPPEASLASATIAPDTVASGAPSNGVIIDTGGRRPDHALNSQPHYLHRHDDEGGDVVKLIDLEKYDAKAISEADSKMAGVGGGLRRHDDGHDGLKQTKKKQLIDTHYSGSAVAVPGEKVPQLRIAEMPATALAPATKAIGYLGPIFMEERTVSAALFKNGAPHQPFIESQLRDGRIVEIIAPTAVLEQTTTSTITTTMMPPSTVRGMDDEQSTPVLSTTVFQVPELLTSTTRLPANKRRQEARKAEAQSESRISDIQIEVYDSTVDSTIVASTNFKDSNGFYASPMDAAPASASAVATTRPPSLVAVTQERFTQYVVDRTDSSTPESNILPLSLSAGGKPEPAAIEIHINVSEGLMGNESEDLEFSYRQSDYTDGSRTNVLGKGAELIALKPFVGGAVSLSSSSAAATNNDTSSGSGSNERSDEILVVEIIDAGGENGTDNGNSNTYASSESVNPIFTFRSDGEVNSDPERNVVEVKNGRHPRPPAVEIGAKTSPVSDELFMVDVKHGAESGFHHPPPPPPPPPRSPSIDRDSDTIFYISNTEVKVGESPPPTANSNSEQQQMRRTRLENQFFPANYMASTHPNAGKIDATAIHAHRYEEDILLSPQRNSADSFKIFRTQGDGAPPLDVTYVGESVMEVEEQSSGAGAMLPAATTSPAAVASAPDVIIQPAILPEMSIGVPVIGELPPQIELKEIDFMPDEVNEPHSGVFESSNALESSIQYGGDLIDEGAGGGFDGVEGSYPFGDPVAMHASRAQHQDADYTHLALNHGGSNLRKDELNIDIGASSVKLVGASAGAGGGERNVENATLREMLAKLGSNDTASMNISYAVAERMGNATAFSVMEDPGTGGEPEFAFRNFYTLIIGLFVVLLPVAVTISMACALRYLYSKYQSGSSDNNDNTDALQPNGIAGGGGDHGESTQPPSPTKSELDPDQESATKDKISTDRSNKTYPSNSCTLNMAIEAAHCGQRHQMHHPSDTHFARSQIEIDQADSVHGNYSNGPNGSVTTMTLKNNHLIVETEERNDISRDARETKMHYNTSDKDGIFVVEVARGADSKTISDSPIAEAGDQRIPLYDSSLNAAIGIMKTENEKPKLRNHEEVLIHQPPPELPSSTTTDELQRSLHQIEEVDEPIASPAAEQTTVENDDVALNAKTGLSQSDLSSTSSTDSNKRYSYGNQELYVVEQTGYAEMSPTANIPLAMPSEEELPDDDHKSENGHSLEHSPAQSHGTGTGTATATNANDENRLTNGHHELNGLGATATDKEDGESDVAPVEIAAKPETETEGNELVDGETVVATATIESTTNEIPDHKTEELLASQITATDVEQPPTNARANGDLTESVTNGEETSAEIETEINAETEAATENGIGADILPESEAELDQEPEPETEPEIEYDSIVSLPAPPSTEEIKQFSDFSLIETNQLDSLPPPPPPAEVTTVECGNANEQSEQKLQLAAALSNGGLETPNGHDMEFLRALAPSMSDVSVNGKVLPVPLTPPASPPTPHYKSAVNGGICASHPMAVDVNGS